MGTQQDLTVKALQHPAAPGRGYALARIISQVFHPMGLSVMSFLIVGYFALLNWATGLGWALFCILLQVVPVTTFFTLRLRQGVYSDEDVSVRQQRHELYIFSMINLLVGNAVLFWMQAPPPFRALLVGATCLGFCAALINLVWKISVHASTAAACATVALLYNEQFGLILWLCALLVGWSRVRTRNHTVLQVVAGLSLAAACVWGSFRLFGLI